MTTGLSRAGWVAVGLAAALILAPAAAVAATATFLHGVNGPGVNATSDHQLLTAQAPPSTWVSEFGIDSVPAACANLPVVSKTRGFIVRQINVDVHSSPKSGTVVYVSRGPGCLEKGTIAEVDANGNNVAYPFDPGVALPPKGQLSIEFSGPAPQVSVEVLGYTVPASDAPAYTPVLVCARTASACL